MQSIINCYTYLNAVLFASVDFGKLKKPFILMLPAKINIERYNLVVTAIARLIYIAPLGYRNCLVGA